MFVDPSGLIVTLWDQENCSIEDYKKLEENDRLWNTGTEYQKRKAAESSKRIRQKYLASNEILMPNGYVISEFSDELSFSTIGGAVLVHTNINYIRTYTKDAIYVQVSNASVSVETSSGFYVDEMYISVGQNGLFGKKEMFETTIETKKFSYSPKWGSVHDDLGAQFTTCGMNVSLTAYRGTSRTPYAIKIINLLYYDEIIYNNKNYVKGIDFYDTLFNGILGGGRNSHEYEKK